MQHPREGDKTRPLSDERTMREALAQRLGVIEKPCPVQDVARELHSTDALYSRRVRMAKGDRMEGEPRDSKPEPPMNRLRKTERNQVRTNN